MAFHNGKKLPKGLDDGVRVTKAEKKRKAAAEKADGAINEQVATAVVATATEMPTIRVGERMSEFSARVDAALPVSGLINKTARGGKDPLGLKVSRTKTEKRMHRMYNEWREQDKRIKEKREDEMELAEEEAMDEDGQVKWKLDIDAAAEPGKKKGKGKKKKKMLGEFDDGDDDPWAQIKRNRAEAKVGLHDVALAPPTFAKLPMEKFKARSTMSNLDSVPTSSGSLRRREELGEVRRSIVNGYRARVKDAGTKVKE